MKSEDDIYNEILNYIKGNNHKRHCTLSSIKKEYRTPKIIELIFSYPKIFHLEKEFPFIPKEHLSERLLIQFVLGNPKRLCLYDEKRDLPAYITEELQTLPILIAFEFAKRKYEKISALQWGSDREKIFYTGKNKLYRDDIIKHSNVISDTLEDPFYQNKDSFDELVNAIQIYCNLNNSDLTLSEVYEQKYTDVVLDVNKRLFILVSGCPDSGKTTISEILFSIIRGARHLDSDELYKRDLLGAPLSSLVTEDTKIVIVSDLYADSIISRSDKENADVINVIVRPNNIKNMHSHSKYMSTIPFEDYKTLEIDKYANAYNNIVNPINVTNDYSERIYKETDRIIEEIAKRIGLELLQNPVEQNEYTKKFIKKNIIP